MVQRKRPDSRLQALLSINLAPASARLPETVPAERRNMASRHALLCRIHAEFEEMRGLSVTTVQAARLFGLAPEITSRVLGQLTEAQILHRKNDGQFALRA
jgi:hypothetical protein